MTDKNPIETAQQWDKARPGFPGEHWLVFGAGVLLMHRSGRSRNWLSRTLGRAAGAALVARAASGQDGVLGKLGSLLAPQGDRPWKGASSQRADQAATSAGPKASSLGTPDQHGVGNPASPVAHPATSTQTTGPYPAAATSVQRG